MRTTFDTDELNQLKLVYVQKVSLNINNKGL